MKVSNINIVDGFGNSFAAGNPPSVKLVGGTFDQFDVALTQNSTTGLWQVNTALIVPTADCQSGSNWKIADIGFLDLPTPLLTTTTLS